MIDPAIVGQIPIAIPTAFANHNILLDKVTA